MTSASLVAPRAQPDAGRTTWRPASPRGHVSPNKALVRPQRGANRRGLRCTVIGSGGGGAWRSIDKRLDAVVDTLPIREVLYDCLDALLVSSERNPSRAMKAGTQLHL